MRLDEWIERYRRAWEEADAEAVGELFTDDAAYRSNPFAEPHRGRDSRLFAGGDEHPVAGRSRDGPAGRRWTAGRRRVVDVDG